MYLLLDDGPQSWTCATLLPLMDVSFQSMRKLLVSVARNLVCHPWVASGMDCGSSLPRSSPQRIDTAMIWNSQLRRRAFRGMTRLIGGLVSWQQGNSGDSTALEAMRSSLPAPLSGAGTGRSGSSAIWAKCQRLDGPGLEHRRSRPHQRPGTTRPDWG